MTEGLALVMISTEFNHSGSIYLDNNECLSPADVQYIQPMRLTKRFTFQVSLCPQHVG